MKYKSKISWWLYLVFAVCIVPIFFIFFDSETSWNEAFFGASILILLNIFIIYLVSKTYYEINHKILTVKAGFLINKKIDIATITTVKETRNPLSAPALSLDRLLVTTSRTSVLISPKQKHKFVTELQAINPEIELISRNKKNKLVL